MKIDQGFSMSLKPVDDQPGIFDLQLYTTLHIGDKVNTRDRILGVFLALDEKWAREIPADQFAYLALAVGQHFLTAGHAPDTVESFRISIADAMETILNASLGD
jgi:hypothetical protein